MDDLRYGDLTDEFEQLRSAEALPPDGAVIVCGDIEDFVAEWYGYVISPN